MIGPLFFLLVTFGEIFKLHSYSTQVADESCPTFALALTITDVVTYTISTNVFSIIHYCNIAASIVTNLITTSLIAYKLWLVNKSFNDCGLFGYSRQELPKSHQQSWSEELTVTCANSAFPSCRVRSLLPWIASQFFISYRPPAMLVSSD
jgi:hypothetical protein